MPEAGADGGRAAQASARGGRGDEEPGTDLGFEHLSRRAKYYSRVPRAGTGHCSDYHSHVLRGRGERDPRAAAGSDDVRADADRISAGEVRTNQAAAGERGRVPGQVRPALERVSSAGERSAGKPNP